MLFKRPLPYYFVHVAEQCDCCVLLGMKLKITEESFSWNFQVTYQVALFRTNTMTSINKGCNSISGFVASLVNCGSSARDIFEQNYKKEF